MTVWYCPNLGHLGHGRPGARDSVDFDPATHRAEIADDDPLRDLKLSWITKYAASLGITEVGPAEPAEDNPDAELCPGGCGRIFEDRFATNAHLLATHCAPQPVKE